MSKISFAMNVGMFIRPSNYPLQLPKWLYCIVQDDINLYIVLCKKCVKQYMVWLLNDIEIYAPRRKESFDRFIVSLLATRPHEAGYRN